MFTKKYLAVIPTGYFGPMSQLALKKFQSSNGLPTTGTVGPLTRAKIKEISCLPITASPIVASSTVPVENPSKMLPPEVMKITSISPNQGRGGETITILGSGFTSDTYIAYRHSTSSNEGTGQIGNQNITLVSPNELRFTLDSRHVSNSEPGTQFFYVSNSKGVSNYINFTFAQDNMPSITPAPTTPVPPASGFYRDLDIGAIGAEVANLQQYLQSKGFLKMPLGVSMGVYDAITKSAVSAYQSSVGISPADGALGVVTRYKLNADMLASTPVVTTYAPVTSMAIISPTGGVYKDTDSLDIRWKPYTGDFDGYWVMLGNSVTNSAVNLSPNLTPSKYATLLQVPTLKDAYNSMILNSGYSVDQLKDSYRIEIYAEKDGDYGKSERKVVGNTFSIISQP